jgi:hypothetical protein
MITRGRAVTLMSVALVLVAAGVLLLVRPSGTTHLAIAPARPAAAATAPAAPSPVAAKPRAIAKPRATVPHDRVMPAAPTAFRFSGPAFAVNADVCRMPFVVPLDPPGDQLHTVCWVEKDFGTAPGSDSGTSYVLGHAWAQQKLVLNPLSEFATAHMQSQAVLESGHKTYPVPALDKYRVTLTTPRGTLVYSVSRAYLVGKMEAGFVASLMADKTPRRVVVITCAVKNGVDLDQNVIVYADLISSKRPS